MGGYAFEVICQSTYWLTLPPTYGSSVLRVNGSVVHRSKSTVAFLFFSLMFDVMVWRSERVCRLLMLSPVYSY